jgi:hypothetical protein
MITEAVRVESERVQKVRDHVKNTGQTISGFIALAIDEKFGKEGKTHEITVSGATLARFTDRGRGGLI